MDSRIRAGTLRHVLRTHGVAGIPSDALILCTRCGQVQPPSEFYIAQAAVRIAATGTDRGAAMHCRTCNSAGTKLYRQPRADLIDAAKASGCVDCGLVMPDHPEVFDFDHVRPGKVKAVGKYLTSGTDEEVRAEIARCEVVCANCHRIRTRRRVHGTRGTDRV